MSGRQSEGNDFLPIISFIKLFSVISDGKKVLVNQHMTVSLPSLGFSVSDSDCFIQDLTKEDYTFGRGEACDYQFNTPTMRKHPCFQAYSKVHFKLGRVSIHQLFASSLYSVVIE